MARLINNHVFRFKVSVDDVLLVNEGQATDHFGSVKLIEGLYSGKYTEQITTPDKLDQEHQLSIGLISAKERWNKRIVACFEQVHNLFLSQDMSRLLL